MSKSVEVFLAKPRGFCGGVSRAINIVEKALMEFGAPVYVLHEIVHNKRVLSDLKKQGVIFVESLDQVPTNSVAIFSAHGVSSSIVEEAKLRNLQIIDATCPLVTKVHEKAQEYEDQGCQIIIIGNKNHAEVIGTAGRLRDKPIIIFSKEEAATLCIKDPNKVAVVTQTTLNSDDTYELISIIKRRFPKIMGIDGGNICNATKTRQDAVKKLVEKVQVLFVIGSKNSSNSNKLREIGEAAGVPSYLIDAAEDIDMNWLQGAEKIGITAGASAPEKVVQEVINFLALHRNIQIA